MCFDCSRLLAGKCKLCARQQRQADEYEIDSALAKQHTQPWRTMSQTIEAKTQEDAAIPLLAPLEALMQSPYRARRVLRKAGHSSRSLVGQQRIAEADHHFTSPAQAPAALREAVRRKLLDGIATTHPANGKRDGQQTSTMLSTTWVRGSLRFPL